MKPALAVHRDVVVANDVFDHSATGKRKHPVCPAIISPNKHWCWISFLFAIFIFVSPATGTAVSVLILHDKIIVGTDSLSPSIINGKPERRQVCKVNSVNGWILLLSGDVVFGSFDALKIAGSSFTPHRTPVEGMEVLNRTVLRNMPDIIPAMKIATPTHYTELTAGHPFLVIALGFVETGNARMLECAFTVNQRGAPNAPACKTYIGKEGGAHWTGFGRSMATEKEISSNPDLARTQMDQDPIAFVRRAINIEIKAAQMEFRGDVDGPVTVATYDSTGLHFTEPGACKDQPPKNKQKRTAPRPVTPSKNAVKSHG